MDGARIHRPVAGRTAKTGGAIQARARTACRCLFLLALFLLGGCESAQTKAAHKIADALPRAIGPAKHYSVHVDGDTLALARGYARRIAVNGDEVRVAPDATLDTLAVDARGVSFDPGTHRLNKAQSVTFVGTLGQRNLSRYVLAHHANLPGLSVHLRASDVVAQMPVNASGLHTEVSVSGTLAPDSATPDRLDFIADGASVGALPIPDVIVNAALRLINPVFDLSQISFPVAVTQASVINGQIVIRGTADMDNVPPSHS